MAFLFVKLHTENFFVNKDRVIHDRDKSQEEIQILF